MNTRDQATRQPSKVETDLATIVYKSRIKDKIDSKKDKIQPVSYHYPRKSLAIVIEKLPEGDEREKLLGLLEQVPDEEIGKALQALEHTYHIIRTDPNVSFRLGRFRKSKCCYIGDRGTVEDFYNTYCAAENDTDIPDEFTKELS